MVNIAELLKDCPEGTMLYSPLLGEVKLRLVQNSIISVAVGKEEIIHRFYNDGRYFSYPDTECLLFPSRDCRTWEGWKSPVDSTLKVGDWIVPKSYNGEMPRQIVEKLDTVFVLDDGTSYICKDAQEYYRLWTIEDANDGDVLVTTKIRSCPFIYRKTSYKNNLAYYYVGINGNGDLTDAYPKNTLFHFGLASDVVPATKEQRDMLFAKIKEAGYQWDEKNKELKKITKHYDIANFKPKQWVLVRDDDEWEWALTSFSYLSNGSASLFVCINGASFQQCIPYSEDTKHLLGTTDMCNEQYINW